MIDVGQATDAGDRIHGMIQILMSAQQNVEQLPQEMLEFYEIFKTISKGLLQTLTITIIPIGNLDEATNLDKDTEGTVRNHTMDSDTEVWDTHRGDDVSEHGEAYDDLCCELHDNEGWMEDHDCGATTWSKDASN